MRITSHVLAIAFSAALLSTSSLAQELSGTLKKIQETGFITLGHRDSSIPFSYYGGVDRQPVGYSHDLQLKVVEALKKELNLPQLGIRYTLITSQTRIPLVQNGTVDLECGSTTNNLERQRQVDFSLGIFEVGTRLLSRKNSAINGFADLQGKNVVTTAGTTSERLLKAMNAEKKMGMRVISAKDHGEAFLMLESNRAVAFMMDDALLAGEMAKARNPDDWHVVGEPQSFEIYACMLRKDDAGFKKVVDKAIADTFASGEINAIYRKWFQQPIPPKNLNLNFPMSEQLKTLIAAPTDKSAEQI
jgi:glutamate/aspartate transport system substrate-binding protein